MIQYSSITNPINSILIPIDSGARPTQYYILISSDYGEYAGRFVKKPKIMTYNLNF